MSTGIAMDAELRTHLLQADAGILVAVLAQMTGNPSVVDRFESRISYVPDPPEQLGVADEDTVAELADAIIAAQSAVRPPDALAADDPVLFARVAPVALGGPVGSEYIGLLLEQGGFQPAQPVLPRTERLPADFRVAIIGAGMAGMTTALACADAGIDYEIYDRNDEVGGTWYTTVYPGLGVDTPSAYYSLSRDVNGDWSSYYPQGAEYQRYLESVADKSGLRAHTRFSTEVTALRWVEESAQWEITAAGPDGQSVTHANVVIPAAGYLNRPRWPDLEGQDLFVKDNFVYMRTTQGPRRVDVVYRRVDDDFLDPKAFRPDSTLGCAGLLDVYRKGNISLCNAIGTGVADDKSIYPYVPKMVEFYLGEKPILENVQTWRCAAPDDCKYVLDNLKDLVVKRVHGSGGYGMLIGPAATRAEIENFRQALVADPVKAVASGAVFNFVNEVEARTKVIDAHLTDIMMAQDFHDLTGQVVAKVVTLANDLEDSLVKLLVQVVPPEQREKVEPTGGAEVPSNVERRASAGANA